MLSSPLDTLQSSTRNWTTPAGLVVEIYALAVNRQLNRDEQEKVSSNETTLPTPNMTVSNYGPSIRNVHRQNHHFP
jgi:hypothetical protein